MIDAEYVEALAKFAEEVHEQLTSFGVEAGDVGAKADMMMTILRHVPRTGPHGETCDEMGCGICNADDPIDALVLAWRQEGLS